jgi:hypothetical protein
MDDRYIYYHPYSVRNPSIFRPVYHEIICTFKGVVCKEPGCVRVERHSQQDKNTVKVRHGQNIYDINHIQ